MASRSVNKVILIGHLGRDAETKYTPGGAAVTRFSIATNRRWKDQQTGDWKEETDWSNVVLWRAEGVANYLTKGKQVYCEGRLQTRSYEDKDGKKVWSTEVVADDVILLSGQGGGPGGGGQSGGGRGDFGDQGYSGGGYGGEQGGGGYSARPVSMPRSAQRQSDSGPAPQEGYSQGITDDDVPF